MAILTTATTSHRVVPYTKPPSSRTFLSGNDGTRSKDKGKAKADEDDEGPWRDAG